MPLAHRDATVLAVSASIRHGNSPACGAGRAVAVWLCSDRMSSLRLTVSTLSLAFAVPTQDPPRLVVGSTGARIAKFVAGAAALHFRGAVLAARGGKVVAALGVGPADLDGKVENDARTLFELASVTKQFTAAAVLVLVQDGALRLDDAIAQHLPGVPDASRAITVRQLLQHTSGMPGGNGRGRGDDLAAVVPSFLAGGPRHIPGTHWEYWNQGYALLAGIVERAAGEPFVDFCRRRLFAPGGLATACFTGDAAPAGATVAIGKSFHGPARSALEHPYGSDGYQYRGMGGAVASVWDLWHWDRALRGDAVLDAASRRELFAPGLGDYALGWFVRSLDGRLVQHHGGSVRGFLCEVRRFPAEDAFVVVLCNRDDGPMGEVTNVVTSLLFGGTIDVPKPLPAAVGAALLGDWRSPDGQLSIEVHEGLLRARMEWSQVGAVSRGYLVGESLTATSLFDWRTSLALTIEPGPGRTVAAVRLAGLRFSRP